MRICPIRAALKGLCLVVLLAWPAYASAQPQTGSARLGAELADDSRWFLIAFSSTSKTSRRPPCTWRSPRARCARQDSISH
jgi:hypothetical protein